MGNEKNGRAVTYANCNGQEFAAQILGSTPMGTDLLVKIGDGEVILRRVPWMGDAPPDGEHWRYAALFDAIDTAPLKRTQEWPVCDEDCGAHDYRDNEEEALG
jgi:hypothetical protein